MCYVDDPNLEESCGQPDWLELYPDDDARELARQMQAEWRADVEKWRRLRAETGLAPGGEADPWRYPPDNADTDEE